MGDKGGLAKNLAFELDLILSTRDAAHFHMLTEYMSVLDVHRRFVIVGLPAEPLPGFNAMFLLGNGSFIGGSHIECKKECLLILLFAADKGAKLWITLLPMSDAKKKVEAMKKNDLRGKYQFILMQHLKEAER